MVICCLRSRSGGRRRKKLCTSCILIVSFRIREVKCTVCKHCFDFRLLAAGLRPRRAEADELRHCAPETEVFLVGDLDHPGTIGDAVNAAFGPANII